MRRRIGFALAAMSALAACGEEPRLEASAARALHRDVDEVRAAAAAGDRDGALRALEVLARRVQRQQDRDRLSDDDAAGMLDLVAAAKRRVERDVPAPEPTPEATATAVPTAEPPPAEPGTGNDEQKGKGETQGEGKDKEKEKDRGHGKDEGGDE